MLAARHDDDDEICNIMAEGSRFIYLAFGFS